MADLDWVGVLLLVGAVLALVTCGVILVREFSEGWRNSRLSLRRTFIQDPSDVYAAVLAAVENSRFAVYASDERTITVAPGYTGGPPTVGAVAVPPVAHVVMLPTEEGGTQLEVIGARGPTHTAWHLMAQELLNALDEKLDPVTR